MNILLSVSIYTVSMYLNVRIIRMFLLEREQRFRSSVPIYFILGAVNWISHLIIQKQFVVTILLFCLLFLYTAYYFETGALKSIAAISIAIGLTGTTSDIIRYLIRYSNFHAKEEGYYSFLPCILTLALIVIWEYICEWKSSDSVPAIYNIQVIFIAFSSIVLCGILISAAKISPATLCFCLFTIYFINILTLLIYSRLHTVQRNILETKTLEQRITMYQNQFQIMHQSQDELGSLQHDLKNHLLLIQKYLESNKVDSAIQYIREITHTHNSMYSYVHTGNEEINCVLNYLLDLARQMNCKIHTSIKIPSESFISTLDLNILISNLLTNAIEAMNHCDQRYLSITMKYNRNILYISVYNTYQGTLCKRNHRFQTTKQDQDSHGYGFNNIYAVIEKYHGNSSFRTENNIFKADVILYLDSSV